MGTEAKETSHNYDEEDIQEMESLYSVVDKAEAELHYKVFKKVMGENVEVIEKFEEIIEVEEMIKFEEIEVEIEEMKKVEEVQLEEMKKAEEKIKEVEIENEFFKKSVGELIVVLNNFLSQKTAIKRKAVIGFDYIAKSEEVVKFEENSVDVSKMSKGEIIEKLNQIIMNLMIKFEDRELINNYYLN